jgi:D-apiose dehydrogenase
MEHGKNGELERWWDREVAGADINGDQMTRIAIIGLGQVTRNIHLPAYGRLGEQVQIVAGCDVDPEARTYAEKGHHLPALFENPEEMIEKIKPDIVSICTPPSLHHEQTLIALRHGCHVFCEKPLAEDLKQTDEMIRASKEANRYVVVNSQFPYMHIHRAAKGLIGSPEFGRLLFLHAWQTFRPTDKTEAGWRRDLARRICFEFGGHVMELIRFFFDTAPARIYARMPSCGTGAEVVDLLMVEFADGRAASVILDRLSKGPEQYLDMRLDGERASIHTSIGGELRFEIGIHTRERRPFIGFNFVQGGKAVLQDGTRSKLIAKEGINPLASATAIHFQNFLQAIQKGTVPYGTASDYRLTLVMTLAAYDSAQSGTGVDLTS